MSERNVGHTPGPWRVEFNNVVMAEGRSVGYAYCPSFAEDSPHGLESLANARLIAAAPDLLEACRKFVDYYGLRKGPRDELDSADEQAEPIAAAMRAIAKAVEVRDGGR